MNELLFLFHTLIISSTALIALFFGQEALAAFISIQIILANLFVIKPIELMGITATGADAFTIGAVFGFHLLQEFYGKETTKKTIWISFGLLLFYIIMSQIHLSYVPHACDITQAHFYALLSVMPRVALASLVSYLLSQQFDCWLFEKIRKIFNGKYLPLRNYLCASLSQLFDTCLFSFLGLYGIISNIGQIIVISYSIKLLALALTTPFILFARKLKNRKNTIN